MSGIQNRYGLTKEQEAFAHAVVRTGNASEAYRETYDTKANGNGLSVDAFHVLHDPNVTLRVATLAKRVARAAEADTVLVLSRLVEESDPSNDYADSPSARVKALEVLAKVQGMLIDRSVVAVAGRIEHVHPEMANLSERELRALAGWPQALGEGKADGDQTQ